MNLVRDTKYGKIKGFKENSILKWFGIPYAKPPVNEMRFKRAEEIERWNDIKECKKMSKRPYQFMPKTPIPGVKKDGIEESEDCLHLNIWSKEDNKKAPVFVWIYGGANHGGEASIPEYNLEGFAKKGIVAVSFNYRLGPLGFYDFSKIDESFDSNCAISDMIRAMHWVHDNISEFGGDPENVTICGESAGGTGVYSLLSAPSAKGTFQKAIAMSGLADNISTNRTQELNNELYLNELNIDKKDIKKLKTLPVEELTKGVKAVLSNNKKYPGILLTGPVIDDLIPYKPWDAMKMGISKEVKCIFGTCKDEGNLFYMMNMAPKNWNEVKKMLEFNDCIELFDEFKRVYGNLSEKNAMRSIATDRMFLIDSLRCSINQSEHNDVYSYRFDFKSGMTKLMGLNACHGLDVCPALDTWEGATTMNFKFTSKKRVENIHDYVNGSYINFIKSGDPNGVVPVKWNPYTKVNKETLLFDDKCSIVKNIKSEEYELWKDLHLYE